jgi:hypothetical protein
VAAALDATQRPERRQPKADSTPSVVINAGNLGERIDEALLELAFAMQIVLRVKALRGNHLACKLIRGQMLTECAAVAR